METIINHGRKWLMVSVSLLFYATGVMAQQQVTGIATDAQTGSKLPGVNILVMGTSTGTATDANGHYSLSALSLQDTLRFSYIGYQTQTVPINGRTTINIVLKPTVFSGQKMVVVGFGKQRERNITSSISSVSSKSLDKTPIQQVSQALQGKIAGVQVIHETGKPGSAARIRIRGAGTVNNSQPLYVIDGNPGASIASVNPRDIESIQVLKSASAAAIYGARGANGVILITTKSGTSKTSTIQINYSRGVQHVRRVIPMMTARQDAITYNQALINGGEKPLYKNPESLGKGTDWQSKVFRVAPMQNMDVTFSGGSDQATYYIGASYFQQKGIIIKDGYKKADLRIKSKDKMNPVITMGENLLIGYSYITHVPAQFGSLGNVFSSRNVLTSALRMDPSVPVKEADGSWGFPKFSDARNPVAAANLKHISTTNPNLNGSVYLDVTPLKNLVFHTQFNLNLTFSHDKKFVGYYNIYPIQQNLVPYLNRNDGQNTNWNWRNTLTFDTDVGYHHIKIMGGIATLFSRSESISANGQGIPKEANTNPKLRYLNLAPVGQVVGGSAGEYSMLSFFTRLNYDYKDTYLLTGNLRADGSSKFGENNRYGIFPSLSAGWRISNEAFMGGISFINDLKIRGGWGEIGNQNPLPDYAFTTSLNTDLFYPYGQDVAIGQAPIGGGNPNLKWETTKEWDIGLDFGALENTITLSGDYYHKETSGMLLRVPVSIIKGILTPPFTNGGDVVNKGIEFSLAYHRTTRDGFNYDVSVNISHNINKVTKLANNEAAIFSSYGKTIVGGPIGAFYGYVMEGLFQTKQEIENHAKQSNQTAPGDVKFKDLNNDGKINQADRRTIGNPWPKLTYGLTSHFNWKRFDLSLSLQGTLGNDIYAGWKHYVEVNNFYNFDKAMLGAWHGEGTSNTIPRLTVSDPNDNFRASTYYIENGSYLRLKTVQLGYTLPFSSSISNHIKKLRIYFTGENLLTFTGYDGYDPEIGGSSPLNVGVDSGLYPQARIYTGGIEIDFQ